MEKIIPDVRKDILFLEEPFKYPEAFRIKDGDSVKVTYAYDGEVAIQKCRFIDETHLYIGSNAYHISELAERLKKNGDKIEPIRGQKPKLDVIAAKYGENLKEVTIPMNEAAIKKLVGGKYEVETLYNCDKKHIYGALLRGRDGIAVCGLGGRDSNVLTSLHPYWTRDYIRELSPAERPAAEKPDFLEKIDKFKAKAAQQEPAAPIPNKAKTALE